MFNKCIKSQKIYFIILTLVFLFVLLGNKEILAKNVENKKSVHMDDGSILDFSSDEELSAFINTQQESQVVLASGSTSEQIPNHITQESIEASTFTGKVNFSVPIMLPPGRNNMNPNLSLHYSNLSSNSWCGYNWNYSCHLFRGVP